MTENYTLLCPPPIYRDFNIFRGVCSDGGHKALCPPSLLATQPWGAQVVVDMLQRAAPCFSQRPPRKGTCDY